MNAEPVAAGLSPRQTPATASGHWQQDYEQEPHTTTARTSIRP